MVGNTEYVEIVVQLKYLSNFWGTLEMPLINCEINNFSNFFKFSPSHSAYSVILATNGVTKFAITNTNISVLVVTLST